MKNWRQFVKFNYLLNWLVDVIFIIITIQDIDYENDWKLLTIWIGTEDLCQVCNDEVSNDSYSIWLYSTTTDTVKSKLHSRDEALD